MSGNEPELKRDKKETSNEEASQDAQTKEALQEVRQAWWVLMQPNSFALGLAAAAAVSGYPKFATEIYPPIPLDRMPDFVNTGPSKKRAKVKAARKFNNFMLRQRRGKA
jgi:hypothetical protein